VNFQIAVKVSPDGRLTARAVLAAPHRLGREGREDRLPRFGPHRDKLRRNAQDAVRASIAANAKSTKRGTEG